MQLQSLHEGNKAQAELAPKELDAQVLSIDEQKRRRPWKKNQICQLYIENQKEKRKRSQRN